jgi:hypothetical protein
MGVARSRARLSEMAAGRIRVPGTSGFATPLHAHDACEEDVGYLATDLADHRGKTGFSTLSARRG